MSKNSYMELKHRQQREVDTFPIGFAFNDKQFEEQMIKLGLKPTDTDKIYSIGYGGFIRKTDSNAFGEMMRRHRNQMQKAIDEDIDGSGFIKDMFDYELGNHEYDYTRDLTDTLDALDLTLDKINKNPKLLKGLKLALRRYR